MSISCIYVCCDDDVLSPTVVGGCVHVDTFDGHTPLSERIEHGRGALSSSTTKHYIKINLYVATLC